MTEQTPSVQPETFDDRLLAFGRQYAERLGVRVVDAVTLAREVFQ